MAQKHLDRLSAVDASFLAQERENTHMHIGGVILLDGPPPAHEDFLAHIQSRLHLVPRYRQKLAFPPLETGRPVWIDDPNFNISYHVRHVALPPPGSDDQLFRLAARGFSQRLDRSKPLWEMQQVEGLESGGWALISKVHHCLVDGISGADLTAVLFDLDPAGTDLPEPEPWVPQPEPGAALLTRLGVEGAVRTVADVVTDAAVAAARPGELIERARDIATGVGEVAWTLLNAPSDTPFNVTPGSHRRVAFVRTELDELKSIKSALGGTVNDVVLAVVAGALRHFLHARGESTEGVELRACVPISLRTEEGKGKLGNDLTMVMAPLPVDEPDPAARLRRVREEMGHLKESKQALGAKAIANLQDFAPPTILAQSSRLNFSDRFYNLLVTNVPGPQFPLYALGRRMTAMFPIPFLVGDRSLAIAIMSYDGGMNFGLLGDLDSMPDLDVVAEGIEGALAELHGLARKQERVESRKAKRRSPASSR